MQEIEEFLVYRTGDERVLSEQFFSMTVLNNQFDQLKWCD